MGSIYKITNTVNSKMYIGQTRQDAEKTRIRDHLTGNGSVLIKQAIEKYGKDAFTYEILHDDIIPEFLDDLEIEAIEKFNTVVPHGYNLTAGGGGGSHCDETRQRISDATKGRIPWNKGKKGVQAAWNKGKKVNNNWLGRKHTDETRRKISEVGKGRTAWNKGKKTPEEVRRKVSDATKGRIPWNKGKKVNNNWLGRKHTDETRRKISEVSKGRTAWNKGKKGSIPWNKGKKHTDETRQRISNATKGRTAWNKGKKYGPLPEETRRKISEANETPERIAARKFFFSLPPDMDLKEKRKRLRQRFPDKPYMAIYKWCEKFHSETQSTVSDA